MRPLQKHSTVGRGKRKFYCKCVMKINWAKTSWRITILILKNQVSKGIFGLMEYEHENLTHNQGSPEKPSTMPPKSRIGSYFC